MQEKTCSEYLLGKVVAELRLESRLSVTDAICPPRGTVLRPGCVAPVIKAFKEVASVFCVSLFDFCLVSLSATASNFRLSVSSKSRIPDVECGLCQKTNIAHCKV